MVSWLQGLLCLTCLRRSGPRLKSRRSRLNRTKQKNKLSYEMNVTSMMFHQLLEFDLMPKAMIDLSPNSPAGSEPWASRFFETIAMGPCWKYIATDRILSTTFAEQQVAV